jgi:hypothetical protein
LEGKPHVYDSDWTDLERLKDSTFYLMPISAEELAAVMETLADQRGHPNWGTRRGPELTRGTKYPNLMGDPSPFGPVWDSLIRRLRGKPAQWPWMAGEFQASGYSDEDCVRLGHDWVPLEVQWTTPVEESHGAEPGAAAVGGGM